MRKRAADLSLEELAAMGANASLRAANKARQAGLVVTGTIDFFENGQPKSTLARRYPSGVVTLLETDNAETIEAAASAALRPLAK